MIRVTEENQHLAMTALQECEPSFAAITTEFGVPPLWQRPEGFPTLIRIILEQQVSLASAKAAFEKLQDYAGNLSPERFLQLGDDELKSIGFSRQKTAYGRNLSQAIITGMLNLGAFHALSDDEIRTHLTAVKGIGIWTANIYLLMAMQRPDVWPRGDIALASAYAQLKSLPERPSNELMEKISDEWKPYRSVAARLLWHFYLERTQQKTPPMTHISLKSNKEYGLPSRTVLEVLDNKTIAIVINRKSRIIMADGRKLLDRFMTIKAFHPNVGLTLKTTAPVCSKTARFLDQHGIRII